MAYKKTERLIKYNNAYNLEHYDRINLVLPKGSKERIKVHADAHGEKVNAFILRAINKLLDEEQ